MLGAMSIILPVSLRYSLNIIKKGIGYLNEQAEKLSSGYKIYRADPAS